MHYGTRGITRRRAYQKIFSQTVHVLFLHWKSSVGSGTTKTGILVKNYYYYVQQGERRRLQDIVNVPVLSELTRQTLPGDTRIRDLVHKLNTEKEDDMLIIGALYGFPMLTTLSMILGGPGNSDEPPSIRAAPRNAGAKGGISDDDDWIRSGDLKWAWGSELSRASFPSTFLWKLP